GGGGGGGPSGEPLLGEHIAMLLSFSGSGGVSISLDDFVEDVDLDGVLDPMDNCPDDANATQADFDYDGVGGACDPVVDKNSVAIMLAIDAWKEDMEPMAYLLALLDCILNSIDRTIIFDYAGVSIPPIIDTMPPNQVDLVILKMHDLIQRIFDRYKEEWPGPPNDLPWVTYEVNQWRPTTMFNTSQRQLIGAYLDATWRVSKAQYGEQAEITILVAQTRQVVMQWPNP
ncbi:MAG TPA: thrombospondin type 3 repeat-containing protein, partial [Myxococcota bacterium]|nr:thrombospondin type 3 repeat-containing protein [Myxococcota bacterium]